MYKRQVEYHISGQLKVAPEHCSAAVLDRMGKPHIEAYQKFARRFYGLTKEVGKEQYLVPYLMSSHPGSTLKDAIELALFLKEEHIRPEQVQDFYPTPGTISTCMFYTGLEMCIRDSQYPHQIVNLFTRKGKEVNENLNSLMIALKNAIINTYDHA